ncbi:MAG TPA: DUF3054 domain-containing protein [Thermoleophilaceae bacterium]
MIRRPGAERLAVADALAIVAFAAIGQLSHHGGLSIAGFARDALPLLAGWFGAAFVFGAYRGAAPRAFLLTWLVGITVGVGIRAAVLGRALNGHEAAFLVTSLVFTLLLILGCRSLLGIMPGWRKQSLRPNSRSRRRAG